jgi:hypothetical protein
LRSPRLAETLFVEKIGMGAGAHENDQPPRPIIGKTIGEEEISADMTFAMTIPVAA